MRPCSVPRPVGNLEEGACRASFGVRVGFHGPRSGLGTATSPFRTVGKRSLLWAWGLTMQKRVEKPQSATKVNVGSSQEIADRRGPANNAERRSLLRCLRKEAVLGEFVRGPERRLISLDQFRYRTCSHDSLIGSGYPYPSNPGSLPSMFACWAARKSV